MAWQCRLITLDRAGDFAEQTRDPGTMWYGTPDDADVLMGDDYKANRAGKVPPLFVRLPSSDIWCIDRQSYDGNAWGRGWVMTGDPPSVTVTPSINFVGRYHGFLQNGVLTDDTEGRTYL